MKCPNCGAVHPGKVCPNCGYRREAQHDSDLEVAKLRKNSGIFIASIVISAFGFIISVSLKSWFFILFGVLLVGSVIGIIRNNKQLVLKRSLTTTSDNSIYQPYASHSVNTAMSQSSPRFVDDSRTELNQDTDEQPLEEITPHKSENHYIAGTSFRQEIIEQLLDEYSGLNPLYTSTKEELIEMNLEGTRIYSYEYTSTDVSLVEETENPYDPNAIKVLVDDFFVGYIKKGSCSHVKKLLHSGNILRIKAEVCGGNYKCLVSEWDDDRNDFVYDVIKSDLPYFVTVNIQYKN